MLILDDDDWHINHHGQKCDREKFICIIWQKIFEIDTQNIAKILRRNNAKWVRQVRQHSLTLEWGCESVHKIVTLNKFIWKVHPYVLVFFIEFLWFEWATKIVDIMFDWDWDSVRKIVPLNKSTYRFEKYVHPFGTFWKLQLTSWRYLYNFLWFEWLLLSFDL